MLLSDSIGLADPSMAWWPSWPPDPSENWWTISEYEGGYVDLNISLGHIYGLTGGAKLSGSKVYPYAGAGLLMRHGIALTLSPQKPVPGPAIALQAGYWLGGQIGWSFGKGGGLFWEIGFVTPGASLIAFWVFPEVDPCNETTLAGATKYENESI